MSYDETEAEGISVSDVDFLEARARERDQYHAALAAIEAILRTPEWSVGMLEDIAEIVKRTGVVHPDPPQYVHH